MRARSNEPRDGGDVVDANRPMQRRRPVDFGNVHVDFLFDERLEGRAVAFPHRLGDRCIAATGHSRSEQEKSTDTACD